MEAQMLLKNRDVYPTAEVLEDTMGKSLYCTFAALMDAVADEHYGLEAEWRYYNDGKVWLCKMQRKKKTVLWLSVWNGFFKVSIYFTEKHREGIAALNISEAIKQEFAATEVTGRLIPMFFDITHRAQLDDLLTVVRFKK